MEASPCKNCTDRKMGCHSECSKYIKYLEIHNKEKQEIYKNTLKRTEYMSFISVQRTRDKKRKGIW